MIASTGARAYLLLEFEHREDASYDELVNKQFKGETIKEQDKYYLSEQFCVGQGEVAISWKKNSWKNICTINKKKELLEN